MQDWRIQDWLNISSLIFKKRLSLQFPQLFQYSSAPRLLIGLVPDRLYRFLSFFWAAYTLNEFCQLFCSLLTVKAVEVLSIFRLSPLVFPFSVYIEFPRLLTGRA